MSSPARASSPVEEGGPSSGVSLLSRVSPRRMRPPTLPPSTPSHSADSTLSPIWPTPLTLSLWRARGSPPSSPEEGTKAEVPLGSPITRIASDNARSNPQAPMPTRDVSLPPADNQKRPALPPQGVCFAESTASPTNDVAIPSATATRAPPQRDPSQKISVLTFPIHHSLPSKPPPAIALPRGIKRERPPSPDLWTAPGIVRVHPPQRQHTITTKRKRRWPTIAATHRDTLKGDGDLGIRRIAFSSDGSRFAISCCDRTVRIWDNRKRVEIARLGNNSQIIGIAWVDDDAAVMALGEDGVLGKWMCIGQERKWQWARVINVGLEIQNRASGSDDAVCLACARDRIAVAFPRSGVKVWIWCKGSWLAQRSIMRSNVTVLKFIDGGDALLGGTREGVVWHCAVPNGTMKVYAFLQSRITSISTYPAYAQALIGQAGGTACLLKLGAQDDKRVERVFGASELVGHSQVGSTNASDDAVYAAEGKMVVFGVAEGCLLVWDVGGGSGKGTGTVVWGLEWDGHDGDWANGDAIQAVAGWDDPQEGCLVAGTRQGRLIWWPERFASPSSNPGGNSYANRKRVKVE
ncbi:WD40-repeat-containing domain protein [Mycena filopes]|nr:WD40-repeat-containing domain protein [Mycena filopes]